MKALKIAGAAIAVLMVAAAALLTIGIPSSLVTSAIQTRVERETGYRIAVAGATRLGFWPSLNVTVHDVTLSDPADREVGSELRDVCSRCHRPIAGRWRLGRRSHPDPADPWEPHFRDAAAL